MELSEKQKLIVNSKEPRIVVCASAAAGKSAVLVARIQRLLDEGIDPSKIVALTFTNAAAENIYDRLTNAQGIFVGTIHSYVNYLLMCGGIDTSDILDNEQFDRLFKRITEHKECVQKVDYLLLDEAQDSTEEQFEVLLDYIKPKNWFLIGDWRQSIYGFLDARPDILIELSQRNDVKHYSLNENYRNSRKILDYAKGIIRLAGLNYRDESIPMRNIDGRVMEREFNPDKIADSIKAYGNYGEWFVLTRTNDEIDVMARALDKYEVPYISFKRSQFNQKELNEKLKEPVVKLLTIHAAKGLEANKVVVIGARYYNLEEKCISYVAATRARDLLVWARNPSRTQRQRQLRGISDWE